VYKVPCSLIVGGFYGDEGKGKIASYLAVKDNVDLVARGGVGPNAGHTVFWKRKKYKMRMLPSGFVNPKCRLLIGPGVLVNPDVFLKETKQLKVEDRVGIDSQCAIIEKQHIKRDRGSNYLKKKIETTGTGCGPCNVDRVSRTVKLARDLPELEQFLVDVPLETNKAIDDGKTVLIEGTQGTFLSLFHGTYPYVTSKDVTASSIAADIGIGPKSVNDVIVVFKAYVTRVGGGPLKDELTEAEAKKRGWAEVATVTGRRRRSAPFDFNLAKRAVMLNSATYIAITKLDILYPECKKVTRFKDLPEKAVEFIAEVEDATNTPVKMLGTGPSVEAIIDRR
jgi:adenylosuccinate synthase